MTKMSGERTRYRSLLAAYGAALATCGIALLLGLVFGGPVCPRRAAGGRGRGRVVWGVYSRIDCDAGGKRRGGVLFPAAAASSAGE